MLGPESSLFAAGGFATLLVGLNVDESQLVFGARVAPSYAEAIVSPVTAGRGGLLLDAGFVA